MTDRESQLNAESLARARVDGTADRAVDELLEELEKPRPP